MNIEWSLITLSAFLLVMQLVACYRRDGVNVFGYWVVIMALAFIAASVRM